MAGKIGSFKLEYRTPKMNAEASLTNSVKSKITNNNLKYLNLPPLFEKRPDHLRPTARQYQSAINPG
jgi:hypothetical protein